jgi:hypothetical protein
MTHIAGADVAKGHGLVVVLEDPARHAFLPLWQSGREVSA